MFSKEYLISYVYAKKYNNCCLYDVGIVINGLRITLMIITMKNECINNIDSRSYLRKLRRRSIQ